MLHWSQLNGFSPGNQTCKKENKKTEVAVKHDRHLANKQARYEEMKAEKELTTVDLLVSL